MISKFNFFALARVAFNPLAFAEMLRFNLDLFDSPSPPSPDPAIGEAARTNAEIGLKALDFQRQVYEEGRPRQAKLDELGGRLVDSQIGLSDLATGQAKDYFGYAKSTFRPVETGLAADAMSFDTEGRRAEIAGRAAADVEQQAGLADAGLRRQAAAVGINPADAAFADTLASASLNKTAAKVGAMNNATIQARNEGRAFKFDVAGLGRNLPAAGATSAQTAIAGGNAALNAATAPAANARADAATSAGLFGSAVGANNAAGNLMLGQFGAQMGAYNAQQQADSSLFGGLGSLAGTLGTAYLLRPSSKDVKQDKTPVKADLILEGLEEIPVEAWRYKKGVADGGATKHIGPYAEDVQEQFGDAAAPDGEGLDMVTMNGIALAGIQALAKKVRRLERDAGLEMMRPRNARDTEPRRTAHSFGIEARR
ncbi:MAG: tail fiber domain-containing protein [Betaproteobacteria bacterium]|nr:MAG: tail fiber domain-containing protein [Betaproteobacteria bacterium]